MFITYMYVCLYFNSFCLYFSDNNCIRGWHRPGYCRWSVPSCVYLHMLKAVRFHKYIIKRVNYKAWLQVQRHQGE